MQPASGSEFKLNEAPRINLSKTEQDWATIVHGPESDSELEENLLQLGLGFLGCSLYRAAFGGMGLSLGLSGFASILC